MSKTAASAFTSTRFATIGGLLSCALLLAGCGSTSAPVPSAAHQQTVSTLAFNTVGVEASSSNTGYAPVQSIDGDLATRWSANGLGSWIRYDLGEARSVGGIQIAFYRGANRKATVDVEVSADGTTWSKVLAGTQSSGTTDALESFDFPGTTSARFVRIVNLGNTENTAISLTEVRFLEVEALIPAAVSASAANSGYPAANSVDGKLDTWWSANGVGQWVRYDFGKSTTLDNVSIAFLKGNVRKASFDVEVSADAASWTKVITNGQSSGTTLAAQTFTFPATGARYLRVVNLGNTENTAAAYTEVSFTTTSPTGLYVAPVVEVAPAPAPVLPTFKSFYVDGANGSDSNDGLTPATAWKSLSKANAAVLAPGESLLFKRGTSYSGTLSAKWSGTSTNPITIGAYGEGANPWIRSGSTSVNISGQFQVLEHLQVTTNSIPGPNPNAVNCKTTPMGWRTGFMFASGSSDNTVRHSLGTGLTAAIHFAEGSSNNNAFHNRLVNNTIMSANTPPAQKYDDDSGAWGVLLNGDNNEIAYNYFEGNTACSEDYGVEGASLEIYKGSNNNMHHNTSINDTTFTELGGNSSKWASNNRFEFNLYAPMNTNGRGEALVIRGRKSSWGANPGTVFNNNTVYNSNLGVFCGEGCAPDILSMHNNVIVTRAGATKDTLWTDGAFDQSNNVFWQLDGQYKVTIAGVKDRNRIGSSFWGDPKFTSPAALDFTRLLGAPLPSAGVFPQ